MRKHDTANGNGSATAVVEPPPLRNGDRLTRAEFMRRWELHPEIKFAELMRASMPSPLSPRTGHGP